MGALIKHRVVQQSFSGAAMKPLARSTCLLVLLALSHQAFAQGGRQLNVPPWVGGANFQSKSKQFENCSASFKNERGITVSYFVDRRFNWRIAFSNPDWDLGVGHKLRVMIRTGDEDNRNLEMVATSNKSFEVSAGDPIALFERIRFNRSIRVQAGGLAWDFPAIDSSEVTAALVDCVLQHTPAAPRSKSTNSVASKALQLVPSADPRTESRAITTGLLAQLGLTGFQYVAPGNAFPFGRTDTAWRKEMITGTVSVVMDRKWDQGMSPFEIFNGNTQVCRGQLFVIATQETVDRAPIARSFISCREIGDVVSGYYLALPRAAGGYFQIATIQAGLQLTTKRIAEDLDLKIRSLIVSVIAKHGASAEQ